MTANIRYHSTTRKTKNKMFVTFCFTMIFLFVTFPKVTNAALTSYVTRLFGSTKHDYAVDIAADGYNALWVIGSTTGTMLPSDETNNNKHAGSQDLFVTRFDMFGDRFFTYQYGGEGVESPTAIALDRDDNAIVVGTTNSKLFPEGVNTLGVDDIFISKFAARTATPENSSAKNGEPLFTFRIGGSDSDTANDVVVVGDTIYVTGESESTDADLLGEGKEGEANTQGKRSSSDVILYQVSNKDGSVITKPLIIGGNAFDSGISLTSDASGNIYLLVATESDSLDGHPSLGGRDMVVMKFAPSKTTKGELEKIWSVRIGGSNNDYGISIGVSPNSNHLFITGMTKSTDFPGAISSKVNGNLFLTSLNAETGELRFSKILTLMKGEGVALAFDTSGKYVYVSGTNIGPISRNLLVMYSTEDGELVDYGTDGTANRKERTFGIAVNGRNEVYTVGDTSADEYNGQTSNGKNDATFLRWVLASKEDDNFTLTITRNDKDDDHNKITSPSYDEL